ncbi:hypothetical protein [Aurantimonas sp. 22II-16-19i]|uniref:hypothetical protein n=1 Tax=Aurantimonas sp. 22II-16-19i TaxID=1317114 RepID=UPI00111C140E|nr:hypothetical protein [Aurantimonas sp. 22II-16-19i]
MPPTALHHASAQAKTSLSGTTRSSNWPTSMRPLPQPETPTLAIELASLALAMPRLEHAEEIGVAEPADPDPLPKYPMRQPAETRRTVERDPTLGVQPR